MGTMLLSAFADEYADNFDRQLDFLAREGIGLLEIRGVNGRNISALTADEVRACKKSLDDSGIRLSSIGSPVGKFPINGRLSEHLDTAKRVYEAARELDCRLCRVFSFYLPDRSQAADYREQVMEGMDALLSLAEGYGMTLCLENEWGLYGESPESCHELMRRFEGRLRCVYDMGNHVLNGYKPYPEAYHLLREDIEYFHIKDALSAGAIVPAGCGEARIREILDDYAAWSKRDFIVSLEPHLQTFSGLNQLTDKAFDNPYKFESREAAFEAAIRSFRGLWQTD